MSYLGPDNMELPETASAGRKVFVITDANMKLAELQLAKIEPEDRIQWLPVNGSWGPVMTVLDTDGEGTVLVLPEDNDDAVFVMVDLWSSVDDGAKVRVFPR